MVPLRAIIMTSLSRVVPAAEKHGYSPDCVITPDITGVGRPTPFMLFECMRQLNVFPVKSVVKVGDTLTDILEGKNAGAWSGSRYGNR